MALSIPMLHLSGVRPPSAQLNQSQGGIYIDTGLGSAANTVIPANAGIQGTVQNVLSLTAYARCDEGILLFQVALTNTVPIAEAAYGV